MVMPLRYCQEHYVLSHGSSSAQECLETYAMFNSIDRPYKERTANSTINKIRRILKGIDLVPEESFHANPFPQIYSVSIELPPEKGGFRTNGKGRTIDFCLASAYAEYMERTQNLLFATFSRTLMQQLKKKFSFFYCPDEIYLNLIEFNSLPDNILADFIRHSGQARSEYISAYFKRIEDNGMPGVVALPFFDTMNSTIIYLPINLLLISVGSNGMAAGNTMFEAIFQAICELLERWSAALIFYNRMTPPTVPDSYLNQFTQEFEIIRSIEADGKYQVIVKDFSAGLRIPSVGIIIKNRIDNSYRLNVGCETSFQVALSRCLTEIFQGMQDTEQFDQALLPIPQKDAEYFVSNDQDAQNARYIVFTQFTKDGSGQFPVSLFDDKCDYPFQPGIYTPRQSFAEEVRYLVSFLHQCGYNVYIRDVSFLGFPSVFVYVPEISAQGRKTSAIANPTQNFQIVDLDAIESLIFKFGECSNDDLMQIANVLETFEPASPVASLFNVDLLPDSTWNQLSVFFLVSQIWYQLRMYTKSKRNFQRFLKTRMDQNAYYKIMERFLDMKVSADSTEFEISQLLIHQEEDNLDKAFAHQVIEDMVEPYNTIKFTKLPQCPDCDGCSLHDDCLTTNKLVMANKIYAQMVANKIDQSQLSRVISH